MPRLVEDLEPPKGRRLHERHQRLPGGERGIAIERFAKIDAVDAVADIAHGERVSIFRPSAVSKAFHGSFRRFRRRHCFGVSAFLYKREQYAANSTAWNNQLDVTESAKIFGTQADISSVRASPSSSRASERCRCPVTSRRSSRNSARKSSAPSAPGSRRGDASKSRTANGRECMYVRRYAEGYNFLGDTKAASPFAGGSVFQVALGGGEPLEQPEFLKSSRTCLRPLPGRIFYPRFRTRKPKYVLASTLASRLKY